MATIRIFSQPTCPACNELKDYLKQRDVEFEDLDITSNKEALNEMTKVHKVRVTPLLLYGDRKIIGFDPVEIDQLITQKQ